MTYYAHVSPDGRKQTLLDHEENVSDIAAGFAKPFHAEIMAEIVGLLHDIGKYSYEFQTKRLTASPNNQTDRVDHSTAGAIECYDQAIIQGLIQYFIPAFAIAGHHAGLPDFGTDADTPAEATLKGRYKRKGTNMVPDYSAYKTEIPSIPAVPANFPQQDGKEISMYIRMIFSCLVDADFLDTEAFFDGNARPSRTVDFNVLLQNLNRYTAPWQVPTNVLNKRRQEILNACRQKGKSLEKGLFTLTVPTGGGKTIASLAFALEHAVKHNLSRVIYVIPYTSIIDQTADIFRRAIGGQYILEHHSNKLYAPDNCANQQETLLMARATENWDMPIVVTTSVQFFESLYACKTGRCRKLHNIANSVIVFDEAQLLPLEHIRPCVYAIDQLVKNYECSAVLCTATQPALDPIFKEFDPDRTITELCPTKLSKDRIFQRVHYRDIGTVTQDKLVQDLTLRKQVLCVVNERKTAQTLYNALRHLPGTFHLSTYMYPEHRRRILKKIKQRMYHHKPCRVISTSLIEAGIDLDFPAVFREETGLDSILQAGGRCNRNGKARPTQSVVTVFNLNEPTWRETSRRTAVYRQIRATFNHIDKQDAISKYFAQIRELAGQHAQDNRNILNLSEQLKLREIGTTFHMISDSGYVIYIPANNKVKQLLSLLENHKASVKVYRRLHNYIVPVYQQTYQRLYDLGLIRPLDEYTGILNDMSVYSDETGLPHDPAVKPIII